MKRLDVEVVGECARSQRVGIRIAGLGALTALGRSADETFAALLAGRFISNHAYVPDLEAHGESRVDALARVAAAEAITHSNWSKEDLADSSTALLVGTSKGDVVSWVDPGNSGGAARPDEAGWGMSSIATRLAHRLNLGDGPRLTLSAACASGLHALARAVMLLRAGQAQRALVVAAESSLHPLFIGSFERLGILARPPEVCRPFDRRRSGFFISEAAAALCIENAPSHHPAVSSKSFSGGNDVWIDNICTLGDAYHITAGDPNAAALRYALRTVTAGGGVDLLHAHGTGTAANDEVELAALESAARDWPTPPVVYSHKGALGHSLGASGLLAAVINVQTHRHGAIPGNANTTAALPSALQISTDVMKRPVRRSIALAAGFGGAISALALASD